MNRDRYSLEAGATPLERGFLNALWKDPYDEAARMAFIDYLTEEGRLHSAAELRAGLIPGFGKLHTWHVLNGVRRCEVCSHAPSLMKTFEYLPCPVRVGGIASGNGIRAVGGGTGHGIHAVGGGAGAGYGNFQGHSQ